MGTWGEGSFSNDSALDWMAEFKDNPSEKTINQLFDTVLDNSFPDAPDCQNSLAAAEIIAAAKGNEMDYYPKDLMEISINFSEATVEKAKKTIERIRDFEKSELRMLWANSSAYGDWQEEVTDLLNRVDS